MDPLQPPFLDPLGALALPPSIAQALLSRGSPQAFLRFPNLRRRAGSYLLTAPGTNRATTLAVVCGRLRHFALSRDRAALFCGLERFQRVTAIDLLDH
jgi:hypothetical protein